MVTPQCGLTPPPSPPSLLKCPAQTICPIRQEIPSKQFTFSHSALFSLLQKNFILQDLSVPATGPTLLVYTMISMKAMLTQLLSPHLHDLAKPLKLCLDLHFLLCFLLSIIQLQSLWLPDLDQQTWKADSMIACKETGRCIIKNLW